MNSKQSISVLLMMGLLVPLTACGETKETENGSSSPTVTDTPANTGTTATKSPVPSPSNPKDEGGEGGEGK
jgi:hypothetical protein